MARNLVPSNEPPAHMAPASPNLPAAAADFSPVPVEEGSEGFQWQRYVSALRRYKWLILLITVLGTGIGVVATRFLTPQYDVQATIWIESPPAHDGPIRAQGLLESYAWVELLKTYTVLDSVVQKERLYLSHGPADSLAFKNFALMDRFRPGAYVLTVDRAHKSLTLKTKEGLLVQTAAVGDSIGQRVGLAWQPDPSTLKAGRSYEFGVVTPRDASQALSGQLGTQMAQDGQLPPAAAHRLRSGPPDQHDERPRGPVRRGGRGPQEAQAHRAVAHPRGAGGLRGPAAPGRRDPPRELQGPDDHPAERRHPHQPGRVHVVRHRHRGVLQPEGPGGRAEAGPGEHRAGTAGVADRQRAHRRVPDDSLGADRARLHPRTGRAG